MFNTFSKLPNGNNEHDEEFKKLRDAMVINQIQMRGIKDKQILSALKSVKRHLFVPIDCIRFAYNDRPLPIGNGQTISQPYIVALMTELAEIKPDYKILEVGTGSGYQTAILAELAEEVYTVEIIQEFTESAKTKLMNLGYKNINFIQSDGYAGHPPEAPYDAIIVTAAADKLPGKLITQLKNNGRMIIPIGEFFQELYVVTKNNNGEIEQRVITPVRFVPMVHPSK